ncbi:MAG: MBL fold metallo-hydrolase, partial [Acholeplasmatales bacterium]|nr:MBL fold metallo-hydrolase [Acholeplasmatales bacterium]
MFLSNEEWSNTYILERFNAVFIIDPSHSYEDIKEYIKDKELLGVLLTHAHADHTYLINKFKCPIYICADDAYLLFDSQSNG